MDIAKLISSKHFARQCFYQTKKSFHSGITSALSRRPVSRITVCPQRINLNTLAPQPASLKVWDKHLLCNRIRLYSSTASSDSDKKDETSSTSNTTTESAPEGENVQSLEETSSSEASPQVPESELPVSQQGQEAPGWENNKLDKLYKVLELEVLAYEPSVLDSYQWFVTTAATHLGIQVGKCWSPLRSTKLRFPLLKSAFVHKKHQVHYEVRTHHRFLTFHKLTSSTADTFLEYIERNLPEGVGLKVTRVEAKALPEYLQKQGQQ